MENLNLPNKVVMVRFCMIDLIFQKLKYFSLAKILLKWYVDFILFLLVYFMQFFLYMIIQFKRP